MKLALLPTVAACALLLGLVGCKALGLSGEEACRCGPAVGGASLKDAPFMHIVLFKLKNDAPEGEAQALIEDSASMLGKVPSVKEVRAGLRADVQRSFNLTDFDVGLLVKFADKAGMEAYIEDPSHKAYVEKHKKYWETVRVIDVVAK